MVSTLTRIALLFACGTIVRAGRFAEKCHGKQLKDYSKWSTQDIESNLNKSGIELDFEIDMEYDCGSDINCKDIKGMPRIKVGDSKYFFGLERMDWYSASRECRLRGMHLASVHGKEYDEAIASFILNGPFFCEQFWLSGCDYGDEPLKYYWMSTGKSMEYTNWAADQPDNGNSIQKEEHCVVNNFNYAWNDIDCLAEERGYICEL